MNETQRRIKAYKEALPGLRERVIAVALLLAMSAAMMTSASFAWLTISRRPELTGVTTSLAANGSLEIALVSPDGNRPAESQVGDSSATKGQSITASNITWGNLVNLSDPTYGLDNLTLRPAQLNTASLLDSPLYGAMYGQDGRITQLSSSFAYTTWNMPDGDVPGYFGVSDKYGVRAISSTTVKAMGADITYYNMMQTAKNKNLSAGSMYVALGNNDAYMQSLATMMGLYMTARMNSSNPDVTENIADIENLRDMYADFLTCFDAEADAMAALVNVQLFLKYGKDQYTPYTADKIYSSTNASLEADGLKITNLDQFKKDRNVIASDLEKLNEICSSGQTMTWKDTGLNTIVNNLVNVGTCTIDGKAVNDIGMGEAAGLMSGTREALITNGILYRFEERTGGYISVKNLTIRATVKGIPGKVNANIKTSAPRDYTLFNNDYLYTDEQNTGNYAGGDLVAEDTYGLAVDLWVRTNSTASYLTLEGNVLTESSMVRATGTDANGNTVELYTVTISGEEGEGNIISVPIDVYWGKTTVIDENGNASEVDAWINAENHSAVTDETLNGATPVEKMTEVITVMGFEGENRVWGDNDLMSTDATTQGSGSCYVYYADSPEDQARSLHLLEAFNVAFVDDEGKLLASAVMDTERFYAANGRVVVPLVLSPSDSINLGEDYQGVVHYAITPLEKNVPTRITAIVYLDGTKLTNEEVLAASDIQGQLNIQFGSSTSLEPLENEELENATRRVSATVSQEKFDYDTATGPMTTTVTVHVDGEQPNQVTAFFLRSINASQGSREKEVTFTQQGNDWVADYPFTSPGTYILRTVRLDGVDYDLVGDLPKVVIEGFALKFLRCDQANENRHVSILSAANSGTVDLSLQFAAEDAAKLPKTVVGRYLRDGDGSAVNVPFTLDANTQIWSGKATFLSSGNYTLQYLVLDGEYTELDASFWQTASVTLGMRVAAYTTSPHSFKYIPSEMTSNQKLLAMQVMIEDNSGKEMPGLSGVKLTYSIRGSGTRTMDADLVWNGSAYVGELTTIGPGIWEFSSVTVGDNILTNVTAAPTFTIQSPEPPTYYKHETVAYQFNPQNNSVMNAQITHSSAATVQAYIVKAGQTNGVWVDGVIGNDLTTTDGAPANNWNFEIPKDANGYQDGHWQLTQLKLWDVFAADGTEYTQEAPLIFDVSATNNVTKAVGRIYVSFAENKSANFGKDASGNITGKFMDSYTISGFAVDIRDFENQPIAGVKDVKLAYAYGENSAAYGGYTSDSITAASANFEIKLANDGSGTRFVHNDPITLQYAGSYTPTFSFAVSRSGQSDLVMSYTGESLPVNTPVYTVWSVTPTITIAARTNNSNNKGSSSTNGNEVTVVFGHSTESSCGITYHNYTHASVTLKLVGIGNATNATLTFAESTGATVQLYTGKSSGGETINRVDGYTWTADGDCLRWVGYLNQVTGSDRVTPAGTIKATELILTYNNVTFKVDIADITINNPAPPS